MHLAGLWLTDFRGYEEVELRLPAGVTVISGANAQGKTSLLEAVTWVARLKSFRGVPDAALVRAGHAEAVVRAEIVDGARVQLFEAVLRASGRNQVLVNRQRLRHARDLAGLLRVTVFAPDDLELVKGGPAGRREYLDDLLSAVSPRHEAARADYERVLRHRNTLLRGGVRDDEARATLEVFDLQLARAGGELARGRLRLVDRVEPLVAAAYAELAGPTPVSAVYEADWLPPAVAVDDRDALTGALLDALASRRREEIDRGVTLRGPHRDEWRWTIDGLDSRTHASQGEQRTLALALRLGGHSVVTELTETTPVLLLDDVFSELDERRSRAIVARLDAGQTIITTAGAVPHGVHADRVLRIDAGRVEDAA